jgi:hypothetical protein
VTRPDGDPHDAPNHKAEVTRDASSKIVFDTAVPRDSRTDCVRNLNITRALLRRVGYISRRAGSYKRGIIRGRNVNIVIGVKLIVRRHGYRERRRRATTN